MAIRSSGANSSTFEAQEQRTADGIAKQLGLAPPHPLHDVQQRYPVDQVPEVIHFAAPQPGLDPGRTRDEVAIPEDGGHAGECLDADTNRNERHAGADDELNPLPLAAPPGAPVDPAEAAPARRRHNA